jgi:hypothetical protein
VHPKLTLVVAGALASCGDRKSKQVNIFTINLQAGSPIVSERGNLVSAPPSARARIVSADLLDLLLRADHKV